MIEAVAGVAFPRFTTTVFGLPDDPVLAHVGPFGLVSALLVAGVGPHSVDARLGSGATADAPSTTTATGATD